MRKETVYCDWCGKEIETDFNMIYINNDLCEDDYDVCPECVKRLNFIKNWKENKNKLLSLNLNSIIEVTLGKDSAESWNNKKSRYLTDESVKKGETVSTQFFKFLHDCAPAFEKMNGAYQGVCYPFEIRTAAKNLFTKEEEKYRRFYRESK
jgi:hypothetical protein